MSEPIKVTYGGVEITYLEKTNRWNFIVRGRERNAESLETAKKSIDRPEPKEKTFTRVKAYLCPYGNDPELVEITSVADIAYGSHYAYFWVKRGLGREKTSGSYLYEYSDSNSEKVTK